MGVRSLWKIMPRRRELKGITNNFAKSLNQRNNDFLGYWAVGQFCSIAQENDVDLIKLDLVNFKSNLNLPSLVPMCQVMRTNLNRIFDAKKIPEKWIQAISAEFRFNQEYEKKYHYWRSGLGEHYLVQLKIETDLGYVNSATEGGNVRPHDPKKEQRRNGF
jgi:hypothetical protein